MSQRQHARALAPLAVIDVDDPEALPYVARDLSVGGLFILLDQRWLVGSKHRIAIERKGVRLETDCCVVRADNTGAALEFENPDETLETHIRKLLIELVYEGADLGEHRRAHRFESHSPVLWTLGNAQVRSFLLDLSATGATVLAEQPPAVGAEVYVQLPIVEIRAGIPVVEEVHGCRAEVMRHVHNGFAVSFKAPTEGFRRAVLGWESTTHTRSKK